MFKNVGMLLIKTYVSTLVLFLEELLAISYRFGHRLFPNHDWSLLFENYACILETAKENIWNRSVPGNPDFTCGKWDGEGEL